MSDHERCASCGAKIPAETGVCAYCGTPAAHDANVPPPARDRASEKIERFERLAEHPSFDKWMRWRPADDDAAFSAADEGAELKPYRALVVTKRAETTPGASGGTSYFVTLEFSTGRRREYYVDGEFYGLVADDDIGVAYIREDDFLHFKKIDA